MKVKSCFFFVMLCALVIISRSDCYAQVSTSLDLLNNAKQFDGKTINYKGEVIGDIMIRGDHAWLHVNDGFIAIGIWVPMTLIKDIRYVGDYHKKGDIVEVSGTFHRSCQEHGGDLDIHADSLRKISSGRNKQERLNTEKINWFLCYRGCYAWC